MGLVRLLGPPDGDLHGHPPPVGGGGRPRGVERREGETRGEKYGFDKPGIFLEYVFWLNRCQRHGVHRVGRRGRPPAAASVAALRRDGQRRAALLERPAGGGCAVAFAVAVAVEVALAARADGVVEAATRFDRHSLIRPPRPRARRIPSLPLRHRNP